MALKTQRDEIRLTMKEDSSDETVVCVDEKTKLIDEDSKEDPLEDACEDGKCDCQEFVGDCRGCVLQGVLIVLFMIALPLVVVLIIAGATVFPVVLVGKLTDSSALQFVTCLFGILLAVLMLSALIKLVHRITH